MNDTDTAHYITAQQLGSFAHLSFNSAMTNASSCLHNLH